MAKRVLVVEDEPSVVESLSFLLGRAGFAVTSETDGMKGLDAALGQVPDVLVLDVMLPGLDGYEVLRRLRANRRTRKLPVIMLSAKSQNEDRDMALDCGADMYMTKPFANSEIVAAVEALAGGAAH